MFRWLAIPVLSSLEITEVDFKILLSKQSKAEGPSVPKQTWVPLYVLRPLPPRHCLFAVWSSLFLLLFLCWLLNSSSLTCRCVSLCVQVNTRAGACACVCTPVWGPEDSFRFVLQVLSPVYPFETVSHWTGACRVHLTGWSPGPALFHSAGITSGSHHARL